jgi:outer membrane biosynthesis protein TonB
MSNTPNVSSAISLIYPLIKGASPVVADLAAYTFARKFFSTKTSYAAASLAGVAALVVLCSSTQKQVLNSGLIYLTYKVLLLVLNYRSSPAKSKTATDPHTSTSSSNSSGAASSPPPATEPAPGSSSSNSSGAASSPPPATEPAPGPSATASATPPPSSVPAAAPQSPRRAASQPLPNGHVETPPPSPFNAFPGSPSPAARQADPSASSSPSAAAASATRPRSLEERKEAAETIRARFEALAERFTFTFSGRLNITPASSGAEIQAEIYEQSGFKRPELDVKARSQWSSNTQEFGPLIRAAANEMMTSLSEIELATQRIADPEERRKAVAERLNNDPSINPLTYRTLPNIYRFVRHMKGIIHCPNVEHKLLAERRKIIYSPTLTSSDKEAFYQEGTEKNEWRKLHNQAIAAYTPYLPYLNENLRKLLVQDDGETAF